MFTLRYSSGHCRLTISHAASCCVFFLYRENYLFTCTCPKCESEAGDPDVTSSEDEDDSMEEDA